MITTQSQFTDELNVIVDKDCAIDKRLKYFIDKYEPLILKKILGQEFYNALQVQLAGTLSGEWAVLVNGGDYTIDGVTYQFKGLKWITAPIIYYWYHRDNAYEVANTRATSPKREGFDSVSMGFKMRQAYNEAYDITSELHCFLDNTTTLPTTYEKNYYGAKINGLQWF